MDALTATFHAWEVACRTCPRWTFSEASATEDGDDIGLCAKFRWGGDVETPAKFFCAAHPLIVQLREDHLAEIQRRCEANP